MGGWLDKPIEKKVTIGFENMKVDFRAGEDPTVHDCALCD